MSWQLNIIYPSGEKKTVPIKGTMTLGSNEQSNIFLQDHKAAWHAATIWESHNYFSSPFWIKIPEKSPPIQLGDLWIRESHLPLEIPLKIGDTLCTLQLIQPLLSLPEVPNGKQPWLTQTPIGYKTVCFAKKAADTPLSIYIHGETGTGKEIIAQLIHAWSERRLGPFVPLHCGALSLSLAESELFGHTKGAFTGATHHRLGALMQAHRGTLFLDEIADLPMDFQIKLLRFLENGEIRSVGSDHCSYADVRILCATHRPLEKLVEEGKFRSDLYYRLASIQIRIPPLRERSEDIPLLATQFASNRKKSLTPACLLRLKSYTWPGNVRELRHAIDLASGFAGSHRCLLDESDFKFLIQPQNDFYPLDLYPETMPKLKEIERFSILKALQLCQGNRAQAARLLGIARSTLFVMMKRYQIQFKRQNITFLESS